MRLTRLTLEEPRRFTAIVPLFPLPAFALAVGALSMTAMACVPARPVPTIDVAASRQDRAVSKPGTLIRFDRLPPPPAGGRAYRILYWSTGVDGRPVAVSGLAILPDSAPPRSGRPVVSWAHPTTGVKPQCGPSLSPFRFQMIPGLRDMLQRGWIVTATDYPGLGTGIDHPFLDGPSEGRSVLDAVRAAAMLPGALASQQFALWGHSQGGQAVLFAAGMARTYAPELKLSAVAAAAPATDLPRLFRDDMGSDGGNNLTALTLWSWANVYGASYAGIVRPEAARAVQTIADKCVDTLIESPAKRAADRELEKGFLAVSDLTAIEPWRTLARQNSTPLVPPGIPVFIAQGDADLTVRQQVTLDYAARLCASGSSVALQILPRVGHGWIAAKSSRSAMAWIDERLHGVAPSNDCGRLPPAYFQTR